MGDTGLTDKSFTHGPEVVSVVIPTVGRPELARAIASARGQDAEQQIEIVVVVDQPRDHPGLPDLNKLADIVIYTGGNRRGPFARNAGVHASRGQWIAFLDDDDEWEPNKIRAQFASLLAANDPLATVVASRHVQVEVRSGRTSRPLPSRVIRPGEKPEMYLFRKRRPAGGRASLYTSTLLCSKQLAVAVGWDESLKRHQDWDWVLRASRMPRVEFIQTDEPLVRIQTGSTGSISAGNSWQDSLDWAEKVFPETGNPVAADFLTGQSLRYALSANSIAGVWACLRRIVLNRRVPSVGPILIAAGGLLPRRWIERLMTIIK